MTANLSSFLRFKYSGKGPANVNEEQDLQGFDAHHGAHAGSHSSASRSVGPAVSMGSTKDLDKHYMGTIQESHDESPESPPNARWVLRQCWWGGGYGQQRVGVCMHWPECCICRRLHFASK